MKTDTGLNYQDDNGYWLDAYNFDVRKYVAQMAQELFDMGFDEVVLADVAHPTLTEAIPLMYTREISTERNTQVAVCGMAKAWPRCWRTGRADTSPYIATPGRAW
ncbi:MAG: putative glycoside hydrolase [Oscillospiraceae bacterium]